CIVDIQGNLHHNAVEELARVGLARYGDAKANQKTQEPTEHAAQEIESIEALCHQHNASEVFYTSDAEEAEAIITARRLAIPAVERKGTILLEDVGVPVPRLGDLVRGMEQISQSRDVPIAVLAHAGDGNAHPLLVFDPMDEAQKQRAHLAYGDVMDLAIQ